MELLNEKGVQLTKVFAIKDSELHNDKPLAFLFYYKAQKTFLIEIPSDADEWEVPLGISSYVKKGIFTMPPHHSLLWVQQRIVPPDRQNIGAILRDHKMTEYDEYAMLMIAHGRCEQDHAYLEDMDYENLPKEIKDRQSLRMCNIMPIGADEVVITFADNTAMKCRLTAYARGLVGMAAGGNFLELQGEEYISARQLYEEGEKLPLTASQLEAMAPMLLATTSEAREILDCSRQNIDDLVKRDRLHPIATDDSTKTFARSEVLDYLWHK